MKLSLGKQEYKFDERTARMALFLSTVPDVPHLYDYDRGKARFPLELWGNDENGDCVFVSEANGLIRLQRKENRRTPKITTDVVLNKYRSLTGSKSPGDANDNGFIMLNAFKDWRSNGWKVGTKTFKIDAFGELNKTNHTQLRQAIYLLGGVYFGLDLPISAQAQFVKTPAVWTAETGSNATPGSWGGHAVFAKRYDDGGIYVLTWGKEVYMTNNFINAYADEAWAVVDSLDGHSRYLDAAAMKKHLRDIGAIIQ